MAIHSQQISQDRPDVVKYIWSVFWFVFTSVTLPDKIVKDREEKPVFSNPAVCKGHPHMLTSSIAVLYNVQREFKSKPSWNSIIYELTQLQKELSRVWQPTKKTLKLKLKFGVFKGKI